MHSEILECNWNKMFIFAMNSLPRGNLCNNECDNFFLDNIS